MKAMPTAGSGAGGSGGGVAAASGWPPPAGVVPLSGSVAGFSALELLSRRPDHHSNALVTNNNVSVPLALFGTSALDRVLVERIQLLANVGNGSELLDLGSFRINCSKSTTSNRMKVSTSQLGGRGAPPVAPEERGAPGTKSTQI